MTHIAILGQPPFSDALAALCRQAGHRAQILDVEELAFGLPDSNHLFQFDVILDCHHSLDRGEYLAMLGPLLPDDILYLASTLNASATLIAADLGLPRRVVGFGVLPPLQKGDVVEVARGLGSSDRAFQQALAFWRSLGLEPIEVGSVELPPPRPELASAMLPRRP